MSLKHNEQKIKSIFSFFIFIEIIGIIYICSVLYIDLNSDSDIQFLFNYFEADFTDAGSQNMEVGVDLVDDFYITASKNGTKFYYMNCSGVKRINMENRVYFESESAATEAGYSIAKYCEK